MLHWWNLPRLCTFIRVQTEKLLKSEIHFFLLHLIASIVKLLHKLNDIWGSIPWKATQNRFKMIATITSLKFNQNCCLQELCNSIRPFIWCKTLSINQRAWPQKTVFCLYFRHLLRLLKYCKIYHVLHWYATTVQFF